MLTKSQRVRLYQDMRIASVGSSVPRFDKCRLDKGYPEFDDDQPRGADGKWTSGGGGAAAAASSRGRGKPKGGGKPKKPDGGSGWRTAGLAAAGLLGAGALGVGGTLLARRLGLFGRAGAVAKPKAQGPRSTKPFDQLSRRQQMRREAAVRSQALSRGATPQQADDLVARFRSRATGGATAGTAVATRGGATSGNLVPASSHVPATISRAASTIDAQAAQSALRRYEGLVVSRTNLTTAIEQRTAEIYRTTGQLYTSRPGGVHPRGTVERQLADMYDELAAVQAKLPGARQEVVEWERLLGGLNTAPITDVASKPARRGAFGRPKKRAAATLFDSIPSRRLSKYDPDQRREQDGRFADEGKGRGGRGGSVSPAKPTATEPPPPSSGKWGINWDIARELGINAALIGATIYGGPAVATAGRGVGRVGQRAVHGASRAMTDLYNRVRLRPRASSVRGS